jgi:hypothetical protein
MNIKIDSDFPGGNIVVRHIAGNRIELSPDLRDTFTKWFYWYFEAEFTGPGKYEFHFDMPAVGSRGPAVSPDGGKSWNWNGLNENYDSFSYKHDGAAGRVRFCMGIPYLQENWERFSRPAAELCRSRQGRRVELFTHGSGKHKYLFTARHHCCEMAANYVLEGLIAAARGIRNRTLPCSWSRSPTRTAWKTATRAKTAARTTTPATTATTRPIRR